MKEKTSSTEYREQEKKRGKELWADEEMRSNIINKMHEGHKKMSCKAKAAMIQKRTESLKKKWADPDYRAKMSIVHNNEERKQKAREKAILQWQNPEKLKKLRKPNGSKRSDEWKTERSKKMAEKWKDPAYRKLVMEKRELSKHKQYTPERSEKISRKIKERWADPEKRKKIANAITIANSKPKSEETKSKLREANKKLWANPEFRIKTVSRILNGLMMSPTKPEIAVQKILEQIVPNKYKYVGDGTVVIGKYCPDFIDENNKKIIEVFGRVFHDPTKCFKDISYYRTEQGRREAFQKCGYKLLVIWDDELHDGKNVVAKILAFTNMEELFVSR